MHSLGKDAGTIEDIKEYSKVVIENSYDDLEKMLSMKNQWMKK
jgi:hypothetical protein